jgi:hypothetical protein
MVYLKRSCNSINKQPLKRQGLEKIDEQREAKEISKRKKESLTC